MSLNPDINLVMIPIFPMRKLRLREVEIFYSRHSGDALICQAPKPKFYSSHYIVSP